MPICIMCKVSGMNYPVSYAGQYGNKLNSMPPHTPPPPSRSNAERQSLERDWRRLSLWQRKVIVWRVWLWVSGQKVYWWLLLAVEEHIHTRRAQYAYTYPAHWL